MSHLNGFVDPVVCIAGVRRMPRFIAKRALWKVVPARPLLALVGVVPVERRQDSADTSSNRSSFEACHRALAKGHAVAIFPEGTTHDRLQLAPIHTGAARIALGARAAGVEGITIVPVGILYESKFKLRSRHCSGSANRSTSTMRSRRSWPAGRRGVRRITRRCVP